MHPKLHVRFGGWAGETHQLKSRKGAPVRPYIHQVHQQSRGAYRPLRVHAYSRFVVGWRVAASLCTDLALDALETSNLGPPTGYGRPIAAAGSSLRCQQPDQVQPLHQPAGGSRHLPVGRLGGRFLRQRPRGVGHRSVQTELIRPKGPWRDRDQVEYATLEYVDWFNHRRLLEPIGNIPPAEEEANYHRGQKRVQLAGLAKNTLR